MVEIGCFQVTEVLSGKWRVKNTLTGIEHHCFGTEAEVVEQLTKQAELWKQKFDERDRKSAKKKRGNGFRDRMNGEAKMATAKRTAAQSPSRWMPLKTFKA